MGKGGLRGRLDVSIHKSARAFRVILLADEVKVNRLFGGCLPAACLSRGLQTKLRGDSYDKIEEKVIRKATLFFIFS